MIKSKLSKSNIKAYLGLFAPSSQGIVVYVLLSGLTVVLNQFDMIKKYLELPNDLQISRVLAGWADHLLMNTIGPSRTETLVVGLFWAVVGLGVYLFLCGLSRLVIELDDDLNVRGYVWPRGANRDRPLQVFAEQTAFRLVAVAALLIVVLDPLAAVFRGPVFVDYLNSLGSQGSLGSNQPLLYVVWFVAGFVTWHVVTVLMRLIALRARLFG